MAKEKLMDIATAERIRNDIAKHDVLLYMKGTPVFPQCGCSAQAVQILNLLGVPFYSIDVLANPGIRQCIKDYSDWPTIPQLYIKGEFIGGNDIMAEMLETGELRQILIEKGLVVSEVS